jgi:hypothetical protein
MADGHDQMQCILRVSYPQVTGYRTATRLRRPTDRVLHLEQDDRHILRMLHRVAFHNRAHILRYYTVHTST